MQRDLSVIVPCYNEAQNIPELVDRINNVFVKKNINGEILLVNDGSKDNTGVVIDSVAKDNPNIVPIHHKINKGMAGGWRSGLNASSGEYICIIDADLQYLPEDIWRLYREIKGSYVDVVQGYRSSIGRTRDSRYILSTGLNIILNLLFGMNARDNKSGFIVCRKEVFEDIMNYRYKYFFFQTFIAVAAKAKGYTIREVETVFESRLLGSSFIPKFPLLDVAQVLWDVILGFIEFRLLDKKERLVEEFVSTQPIDNSKETLKGLRKLYFNLYVRLMPLHHWMITRRAADYYYEMKKSQWLTPAQIKELQDKKLRKLVNHAYYHVGYYREMFDRIKLKPSDIKTQADLHKIPLLDKQLVRQNIHFDLMSDNYDKKKIQRVTTSGSTGEPFICYADKHQLEIRWAATLRSMEWTGYRFGDKQARLWHQTIGMTRSQALHESLDAFLSRRMFIPAFEMTEKNLTAFIKKLHKYDPVLLDGYAESLNFLAYYIKNHGIESVKPKGIMSSAQILPEQSRKIIEEQFGCGVFDKYGSREFSGIAYECGAHQGHHIVAESFIVEILKEGVPAKPGETGEVVITDLNNYCMPFIRYRIGDLAIATDNTVPCACGRGLPRIGKIEGRVQAIIVGANGSYIPGTFFAHLFKDYDYVVRQYQVIQEKLGHIKLKVVKARRFDEGIFGEVIAKLHEFLGSDMHIDVEFVDSIAMVHTGKQQGSISKLKIDFQNIEKKI